VTIYLSNHGYYEPREAALVRLGAARLVSYVDRGRDETVAFRKAAQRDTAR